MARKNPDEPTAGSGNIAPPAARRHVAPAAHPSSELGDSGELRDLLLDTPNLTSAKDDEDARLKALRRYQMPETAEEVFDDITRLAAHLCNTPVALINLVERERLIHKSKICSIPVPTSRQGSFCDWAIRGARNHSGERTAPLFVVSDALNDERFNEHPHVTGTHGIRFYAGAPLTTPDGHLIGTLCVMDLRPRHINQIQRQALRTLADSVMAYFNLRRKSLELRQALTACGQLEQQIRINRDLVQTVERERERAASLEEREQRYALVVNSSNDGLWDWDLSSNKLTFCNRWKALLGYAEDEIGMTPDEWFKRIHPEDVEIVESEITAHLLGLTPQFQNEHRLRHQHGGYRWVMSRGLAIWDDRREAYRMAGSITDITDQKYAEERLLHNAFHDALTGLPNRPMFMNKLSRSLARARQQEDYMFAVLFIDLDRFKFINDSLGHQIGDQLLVTFARRLEGAVRPGDLVARWGGDEFAIILDRIKGTGDAVQAAQRIQSDLASPFKLSSHEVFVTASIGISHSLLPCASEEEFIRNADTAMYRAKSHGRGGFELYDVGMHEHASERLNLELALSRALAHNEFQVHYQPIISLDNWRITGFEALVRWKHPEQGFITPLKFIPIAEETGMIIPIGQWVLHEACKQIRGWQERFPSEPPLAISVNLSGVQFSDADLINKIKEILIDTGLDPDSLKIEITESAIIENIEGATAILNQLKQLGIKISLDDFGTGYSSLSYLHRFPIDTLKIDRSFVTRMNLPKNREIVNTILTLAGNLGLDVIAEGVETREQILQLTGMKCEYVQGYLLSRPMNGEEMSKLIEETYQKGIGQHATEFLK